MKSDDAGTQPKTEGAHKSLEDETTIKDGMRVGVILTAVNFTVLGLLLLGIQYGVDFVVPDMVLYNNTGHEIEIHFRGKVVVVQKDSSGRVDQPVPCRAGIVFLRECQKGYKPFSVGTVNRKWFYEVVYPPSDHKKRVNSSRSEYRYQIEADGLIYLLEPDSEFPVYRLPLQPSGFPLVHKSSWGERAIIIEK